MYLDWIYCRVVDRDHFIFPRDPFWLGQVEFSCYDQEDVCRHELGESMLKFAFEAPGGKWSRFVRARTLLPQADADEVDRYGTLHVVEAVRALRTSIPLLTKGVRVLDAGYRYDVKAAKGSALIPPRERRNMFGMGMALDHGAVFPMFMLNTLYAAPNAFGELGDAYRRSAHWSELAEAAEDDGQQLLLLWMAGECLCKLTSEDAVAPKFLAAAGFPVGGLHDLLPRTTLRALSRMNGYRDAKSKLTRLVEQLRVTRNNIVHAGFRHVDLPDMLSPGDATLGMAFLKIVVGSLNEMTLRSLERGVRTVAGMWEAMVEAFPSGIETTAKNSLRALGLGG